MLHLGGVTRRASPGSSLLPSEILQRMAYETLRYEQDGHVVVLTHDRPEQRNAVSRQMNEELPDPWQRFRGDPEAFVLVIAGAGDAFGAGWALADAAAWPRPDWDEF